MGGELTPGALARRESCMRTLMVSGFDHQSLLLVCGLFLCLEEKSRGHT